jgi:hypothetical protein
VAFECCENFSSFVKLPFADQETRTVRQEWTEAPDAEGEEDLECERKSPGDISWGKREAQGEPMENTVNIYAHMNKKSFQLSRAYQLLMLNPVMQFAI